MKNNSLYSLVFFFSICFHTSAQHHVFRQFTKKEGLPSNVVYNMLQDSKGYLWFATELGASRYDGTKFQNFDIQSGLPDATVFQVNEDEAGKIWFIPTSCKLSYFENNKIHEYKYNNNLQKKLKISSIYTNFSFHADKNNNVDIGIYGNGRFHITPAGIVSNRFVENHLTDEYILQNKNDVVYVSTLKDIINKSEHKLIIEQSNKTDTVIITKDKNLSYSLIYCILNEKNNILLSIGNCLYEIQGKTVIHKRQFASRIICLSKDQNNEVWVGLYAGGVFCFADGEISKPAKCHMLKNNSVCYALKDNDDAMWFSTLDAGVFYLPSLEFYSFSVDDGLSDNAINSVYANNHGIWLGMNNNSINKIIDTTVINLSISENKNTVVSAMQYDKLRERLWIGTNILGYYLDINGGQKEQVKLIRDSVKFALTDVAINTNGDVWFAGMAGLYKIDKVNNKTLFPKGNDFVWRITSIAPHSDSVFYIGGISGLWEFSQGKYSYLGKENKLFANRINVIRKCDFNNSDWIGTKGAGLIIIQNSKEIMHITSENGLAGNIINSIFIEKNTIYVATDKGLNIIKLKQTDKFEYTIESITTDDGLISDEINYVYKSGNLIYVATNLGLTYFDIAKIHNSLKPPPVYISGIEIMNKDTMVANNFTLKYDQNLIAFNVTGISFSASEKIKYKYMLEGLQNEWAYTSNTQIQFPFLQPGFYKFIVFAQNKDGVWSKKPAMISFKISPPFWKTWWFISFIVLFVISGIVVAYTLRIQALKKRNQLKLQLNKYMQQALIKQMNPHFIFNSLNSIQHFILQNDRMASNKYLTKFSRLMRITLENSQHQTIPLQDELDALTLYMELESLRFKEKFEFEIIVDPEINTLECKIPTLLIQPYIENSIWHGLMHKDEIGKLILKLKLNDSIVMCSIEDNGIGRKKAKELKKGETKRHTSMGTNITENRLKLLNTLNSVSMSVNYTDLYDLDGNATGTRVEICIPVNY